MVSEIEEKYNKFYAWVKQGKDLFPERSKEYIDKFLWGIRTLDSFSDSELRILLLEKLDVIRTKNIKKITPYDVRGLNTIVAEIKNNIITRSHWSVFYTIECLAERIIDTIIVRENKLLMGEYGNIRKNIKSNHYTLGNKIVLLEKIYCEHKTPDLNIMIKIIKLLQDVRNKYMFHLFDCDDYSFIYPVGETHEKEKEMMKLMTSVKDSVEEVRELFKEGILERHILDFYFKSWSNLIEVYDISEYGPDVSVSNSAIYSMFPECFARFAYVLILFLGKDDLSLFDDGRPRKGCGEK